MGGDQMPRKLICAPHPVYLSRLWKRYTDKLSNSTNHVERELLRDTLRTINQYILAGEVTEQQFYYVFSIDKTIKNAEATLLNRAKDFAVKLANCKIQSHLINRQEIILLCNLINNPAYVNFENLMTDQAIPLIK